MMGLLLVAIVGLLISVYGITVEKNVLQNEQYKAACDLSDMVSCTRSFVSPYNKLLGISNIWAAFLFYCAVIVLIFMNAIGLLFLLTCIGFVASLIFAYILYFKMRTICLICSSLYCINIVLMVLAYLSWAM